MRRRQAAKFNQSAYRNKMRAYNRKNKRRVRNYNRPFVETMFREVPRVDSKHLIFNTTTGVCTQAPDSQMSKNAANSGGGTNHAVPQDFTVIVPQAWSDLFTQGPKRDQIQGRNIYPTYLNTKCEIDWSARVKDPAHEQVVGLDDHFMCIQGWAKNSLIKQIEDEIELPTTSANVAVAMGQIVAKCCAQSDINGDRLDFPSKKKDIKIIKHFPVRSNLNNRYADVVATTTVGAPRTSFALPKVYNFSWTIKRKQLLRTPNSDVPSAGYILSDCWVPFLAFYNRTLTAGPHTHTPDLHHASKLYWTDQ